MDNPDLTKSMNYGSGCIPLMQENAFACDSEVAHIRFTGGNNFVFDIARSDGPKFDFVPGVSGKHLNKFPVFINDANQFHYILTNLDFRSKGAKKIIFESRLGSLSPIVEVQSVVNAPCSPRSLSISGFRKVRNLQRLRSTTQNAYTVENNSFYFRIMATDQTPNLYADAQQGNKQFSGHLGHNVLVMDNPDLNKSMSYGAGCIMLMWDSAFACDSEVAQICLAPGNQLVFDITRSHGPIVDFVPIASGKHLNKFTVYINDANQLHYILSNLEFGNKGAMKIIFESRLGSLSPLVESYCTGFFNLNTIAIFAL
eukprot:scaffold94894_cov34-Attheya_sp.AAC.1